MYNDALGDHLQGNMGYQQISLGLPDAEFLLVGTRHPSHWHQGPKELGHVHLGATYGVVVSVDS